jgi:Pvc16 N-terminal domain
MASELDGRLKDWVGSVIQGAEVSLAAPIAKRTGRGVGLYLLELVQSPSPSTSKRPPLQLVLRYLITAWSDKPEDTHQMLVELMFAAMDNTDFQVELEPVPVSLWTAFAVPPQPSFIVRAPLRQERPLPPAKLVREPLKVHISPAVSFHGQVLGPGELPLSECRVELPALNLSTRTDSSGRFHFASVPSAGSKEFLIRAKGFELPVRSEQNFPDSRAPLVIHFSLLEE